MSDRAESCGGTVINLTRARPCTEEECAVAEWSFRILSDEDPRKRGVVAVKLGDAMVYGRVTDMGVAAEYSTDIPDGYPPRQPWEQFRDYQGDCETPDCDGERSSDDGLCVLCATDDDGDR